MLGKAYALEGICYERFLARKPFLEGFWEGMWLEQLINGMATLGKAHT